MKLVHFYKKFSLFSLTFYSLFFFFFSFPSLALQKIIAEYFPNPLNCEKICWVFFSWIKMMFYVFLNKWRLLRYAEEEKENIYENEILKSFNGTTPFVSFFSSCISEFFCAAGENFNFHSIPLPAILFELKPCLTMFWAIWLRFRNSLWTYTWWYFCTCGVRFQLSF